MSAQPIDYEALAKQAGAISSQPAGGVDYGALAKQAGAIDSVPAAKSEADAPAQDYLSDAEDFIHGAGLGSLKNIPFLGKYLGGGSQAGVLNPEAESAGESGGRIYEQGLEMMATGGPLKAGAESLATKLPWLGKLAAPAMRVGAEAINTGASAALHGQPIGTSAALGAGGGAFSEGLQAVAPKLAESALGVTSRLRGHGRTIGQTVLDETSAVGMGKLGDQVGDKIGQLTSELEARADAAGQAGTLASTKPATQYLDSQIAKYQGRNSPLAQKLMDIKSQLTSNQYTNAMIPANLPPRDLLELKRGVGDTINTWEPSLKKSATPIQRQVYRLLDNELDRTVPGSDELNQKISSLMPANFRADIQERRASFPEEVLDRATRHTGALAGSILGGSVAGAPGAIVAPLIQDAMKMPATQMAAARLATTGIPTGAARLGVASQTPETPKARAYRSMSPEQQKRYRYDPEADSLIPIR